MSADVTIFQRLLRIAPWFLRGPNMGRFLDSLNLTWGSAGEALQQGLLFTQPLRCDSSALPALSRDRGIKLYPTEPEDSKRYRLSQWLQLHRQRGTHQGEMRHAMPYFLPDQPTMRIVHQDGAGGRATWHTLSVKHGELAYDVYKAEPSNWDYDGRTSEWSRFWFILYAPASLLELTHWDDGSEYDADAHYNGILDTQVALDLISMVLDWKSAHSMLSAYIIATDPTSFDPLGTPTQDPDGWWNLPNGNWDQPIDALGVRTRPPTAIWLYERRL